VQEAAVVDEGAQTVADESRVKKAGEGVSDEEMVEQVAQQTDSEMQQADVFRRESDGVSTDTEAAKASGEELSGE
jgi:deglycase